MEDVVTLDNMTPAICREHCLHKSAKYYATQVFCRLNNNWWVVCVS